MEQTKTKTQETREYKMNQQLQTFSFNPPINLVEKGKWLIAVSSFEATISVLNISNAKTSLFQLAYQVIGSSMTLNIQLPS